MTDAINYAELIKRADSVASELLDNEETEGDAEDRLMDSCEWDWTIYYGMAMELCNNVPGHLLDEAEEMVEETGVVLGHTSLYEHATFVAFWIVWGAVSRALESKLEEREEA